MASGGAACENLAGGNDAHADGLGELIDGLARFFVFLLIINRDGHINHLSSS
jgi:hypothetical protein